MQISIHASREGGDQATEADYQLKCEETIDKMADICDCKTIWAIYPAEETDAREDFERYIVKYMEDKGNE